MKVLDGDETRCGYVEATELGEGEFTIEKNGGNLWEAKFWWSSETPA